MTAPEIPDPDGEDLDVRIVRGHPTDEEVAAVIAVLHSLPAAPAHRPAATAAAPNGWRLSQRSLRTPLRRGWR